MPKRPSVNRQVLASKGEPLKNVKKVELIEFGRKAMKAYGSEVIEERALADYRDGLKPVHRKILWAMYKMGNTYNAPHMKSARTVGEVIGKYSPHGDTGTYGAMVTMANTPTPLIDGLGNWGALDSNAAAMRYTNARLSKFSNSQMFDENFIPVMDLVPNYDGKEVEPLVTNALLPNVIINGTSGIAVGVTSHTPSYSLESVVAILKRIFSGETPTAKMCAEVLEFKYKYGGKCVTSKKDLEAGYASPNFTVEFKSEYTWKTKNIMLFHSFAPRLNIDTARRNILALQKSRKGKTDKVNARKSKKKSPLAVDFLDQSYADKKTKIKHTLWLAKLNRAQMDPKNVAKIEKEMSATLHFKMNLTERYIDDQGNPQVRFFSMTVPELLVKWCQWRAETEVKSLKWQRVKNAEVIRKLKLLIFAAINRKVILDSLSADDSEKYLVSKLKIKLEEAKEILDLRVRQLSKLDQKFMEKKLKEAEAFERQLDVWIKAPKKKILADLNALKI